MISIQKVKYEQKSILRNLLELYKYDFSEFDPEDDINSNGLYEYKFLDHYWTEDGRYPFFIMVEDKLAGFALVRSLVEDESNKMTYSMAEFFVMKKYRKSRVGETAAHKIFDDFRGIWKVAEIEANTPAQAFWRKTIERYTNGNYEEVREEDWEGPIQTFSTSN
ncbi:GNAT family N-acetyltransferase [Paenibacillus provencensis]|uniref:GNAT family N-acetyltransferase n=1 Tax=Paenibacillus provencensis TaxID=441151 RepID=A0ABW3PTU1_9BACL|nr:GNAT family N-acetyltransferase [Paenibacillus sp. MER 78]MCM3127545.1 GNAT family N-acetyltransferase [Paenibacillus sp. MER 78]